MQTEIAFSPREEAQIESRIEQAMCAGTYEVGVETLKGERFEVLERLEIYSHANGSISEAVKIEQQQRTQVMSADAAFARANLVGGRLSIHQKSGQAAVIHESSKFVGDRGEIVPCFNLVRPVGNKKMNQDEFIQSTWESVSEAEFISAWNLEVARVPEFTYHTFYLIVGLLLPIWKKLDPTQMKVYRIPTESGQLLGRLVKSTAMEQIATGFGISHQITAREIYQSVTVDRRSTKLTDKLNLQYALVAGHYRLEILGFEGKTELERLKSVGVFAEMHNYRMRAFIPSTEEKAIAVIEKIRQL